MSLWQRGITNLGWVGIDLDQTLATYEHGDWPKIGKPVPAMVAIVQQLLDNGREVRIMTARVGGLFVAEVGTPLHEDALAQRQRVKRWCKKHLGVELAVTAVKDYEMDVLLDDRAITVEKNTGRILTPGFEMTTSEDGEIR